MPALICMCCCCVWLNCTDAGPFIGGGVRVLVGVGALRLWCANCCCCKVGVGGPMGLVWLMGTGDDLAPGT